MYHRSHYRWPVLRVLFAIIFLTLTTAPPLPMIHAQSSDIVVRDDDQTHTSRTGDPAGFQDATGWTVVNGHATWTYSNSFLQADNAITYKPPLDRCGKWEVFAFIPSINNNLIDTTHAPYTVKYRGGQTIVYVNQASYDTNPPPTNRWHSLGTYTFSQNADATGEYVTLGDNTGEGTIGDNQRSVNFDDIKWVYRGADAVCNPTTSDTTPPEGRVIQPSDGATIQPGSVTFSADAWDNLGGSGIGRVEFWIFYNNDWHHVNTLYAEPYSFTWNTPSGIASQQLRFTIQVVDQAGNAVIDPGGYHYVTLNVPPPLAQHSDTKLSGAVENDKTTIWLQVCGKGEHYRFQSFSVTQNQVLWDRVYGSLDGCAPGYRAVINALPGEIFRFTSTVMNEPISDSEFSQRRRDTCRVDSPGRIRCQQGDTPPPFPQPVPPPEPPLPAPGHWDVPYYSQGDSRWANNIIGACNNTINNVGCALTSLTMLARFYGATHDPGTMNSCMGTVACPLYWGHSKVSTCSDGKLKWVGWPGFSYASLEQELKKGPVILELQRGDGNMHFIVVLGGSGSDPRNYIVNDPGVKNGERTTLSSSLGIFKGYVPSSMRLYTGTPAVTLVTGQASLVEAAPRLSTPELSPDEPLVGAVTLYRNTETEMVLELAAQSSAGEVTEMQIWTDQHAAEGWQPFTPFVRVPLDTTFYVQYRDAAGNISAEESVTIPSAFNGIQETSVRVYLPLLIR